MGNEVIGNWLKTLDSSGDAGGVMADGKVGGMDGIVLKEEEDGVENQAFSSKLKKFSIP